MTSFEIAFGQKLCIGIEDWNAGQTQLKSEFPARRHALARTQVTLDDGSAKTVIDLFVQGSKLHNRSGPFS